MLFLKIFKLGKNNNIVVKIKIIAFVWIVKKLKDENQRLFKCVFIKSGASWKKKKKQTGDKIIHNAKTKFLLHDPHLYFSIKISSLENNNVL